MATDRWAQIAAIVEHAIALPVESRVDFLRTACGSDAELGREAASLLAHHHEEEALRAAVVTTRQPASGLAAVPPVVPERFEMLEHLGSGGFGTVYRAYDRVHRQDVALKFLRNIDPATLDRFKQEFRKTSAIRHHNVIQLHELFSDGSQWFFSMELLEGLSLLDFIRGARQPWSSSLPAIAWPRLREAFEQLTEGVSALHAAGIVHGDLKPQNVVVTTAGRVVLLDFGLVRDIAQQPSQVAGTPVYMAPEQMTSQPVAEAADWYGVGALLYEALTGSLPFTGTFWDVLWKKQRDDVRLTGAGDLPGSLVALCEDLLQRAPDRRPGAREVRERLLGRQEDDAPVIARDAGSLFVGRAAHLAFLGDAFNRVRQGLPTAVHLHGLSGIGKSTLVRRFLDTVRQQQDDIVVLAGRCYESESVPFKALDEVVDALTRYLGGLAAPEIAALLPRDVALLTRVFPALRRVPGMVARPGRPVEILDPQALRDHALSALIELLERLSTRRLVVLWIDDLQWSDFDSLRVLRALQQPVGAPCLLLILGYRREDIASSPVLQAVVESGRPGREADSVRDLALDGLRVDEAHALAVALYGNLPEGQRTGVVNETWGSPLFLHELARHVGVARGSSEGPPNLLEMIQERIHSLRPSSRRLLEAIATAGQPVDRLIAIRAAEPDDAGAEVQLVGDLLVRASGAATATKLDTYHDKVREAVIGLMSDDARRACHARLARTLEADGQADPERLVHHFSQAGIDDAAYRCALQAAYAAETCLAFDQAASRFRLALELRARLPASQLEETPADPGPDALWRRMADALASAGRTEDAASAYLRAADRATGRDVVDLHSLAVDQLLRGGQINQGLDLLRTTLREGGMRLPRHRAHLVASVVITRARLRVRGLTYRERPADAIAPSVLTRIDRLWTAGATLTTLDPLLAAYLRGHHLLLALRAGEPYRIAVGLALEAIQRVMRGPGSYRECREILDRAREIAVRTRRPYAEAMVLTAETGVAYFSGRVRDALRYGVQGEEVLSTRCVGVAWELAALRTVILSALHLSGQWKEHAATMHRILHEAEENGDRYAQHVLPLVVGSYVVHLAADDPAGAHRELDERLSQWARAEFDVPHWSHAHGTIETLIYEGAYEEAWRRMTRAWTALRRAHLLRIAFIRLAATQTRARCAVALHAVAPRPDLLATGERFVADCARSSLALSQGWGLLIDATLKAMRGERGTAIAKLQLAEERLSEVGAAQYVAASRRWRGTLVGGAAGSTLIERADADLVELGAINPKRMAIRLIPGFASS